MLERIPEINRDLRKIQKALAVITGAPDETELRDAWEQYLIFWKRCLEKMIAGAKKSPEHRPWSREISVQYGADEGATYLWEARNSEDHGVGPFAPIRAGYTTLGSSIAVFGDAEVEEEGNITIGRYGYSESGTRRTVTRGGVAISVSGDNVDDVRSVGARAVLVPIFSDKKRSTFGVPTKIGSRPIPDRSAVALAELGHLFLQDIFAEYVKRAAGKA